MLLQFKPGSDELYGFIISERGMTRVLERKMTIYNGENRKYASVLQFVIKETCVCVAK